METTFGSFLKQKRQEKNLTQKQLAEILFVSESTVSKWEKDVAHPSITLLPKLSATLGVTEHELITASTDENARIERSQAKKWRAFSLTWSWFFYISYATALIPCFICNIAINKTLSWFWIVLSALVLAFTFTNLPKLIKNHKLILIPTSQYLALCLLLGVCAIYTHGNWFWIASLSTLFALVTVFAPIYIAKYEIFSKIRKYNDFISVALDYIVLNILLVVIDICTVGSQWYFGVAFPITLVVYLALNILLSVRFLKINRFWKTGIIISLSTVFLYGAPLCIRSNNPDIQRELDDANIFKANLSTWIPEQTLEQNINLIVMLSAMLVALCFITIGIILHFKRKNK